MLLVIGFTWPIFGQLFLTTQVSSNKCPPNSYHTPRGCVLCRECNLFSIIRSACTGSSDTECVTCAGAEEALQRPECRRCPPCSEGEYLSRACTRRRHTICEPCPTGSYNPTRSYSDVCIPCTSCIRQGRHQLEKCTSLKNTVCGHCKKGFYLEHGASKCVRCQPCLSSDHRVITKCQKEGTGRACGRQLTFKFSRPSVITSYQDFKDTYSINIHRVENIDETQEFTTSTRVNDLPLGTNDGQRILILIIITVLICLVLVVGLIIVVSQRQRQCLMGRLKDMESLKVSSTKEHISCEPCLIHTKGGFL